MSGRCSRTRLTDDPTFLQLHADIQRAQTIRRRNSSKSRDAALRAQVALIVTDPRAGHVRDRGTAIHSAHGIEKTVAGDAMVIN